MASVDDIIRAEAPGRRFADVGGLWGTVNEKATVAALAGAAKTTMVDLAPPGSPLWQAFRDHCAARGVKKVKERSGNIEEPEFAASLGRFDVVYCSGVIYHAPNPYRMIDCLRSITRHTLILGSMTVPEVIENAAGRLEFGGGRMISIPAITEAERRILSLHFETLGLQIHNVNRPGDFPWMLGKGAFNFEPWWWLWTPETLGRMAETCGFRVRQIVELWTDRAHAVVLDRA